MYATKMSDKRKTSALDQGLLVRVADSAKVVVIAYFTFLRIFSLTLTGYLDFSLSTQSCSSLF